MPIAKPPRHILRRRAVTGLVLVLAAGCGGSSHHAARHPAPSRRPAPAHRYAPTHAASPRLVAIVRAWSGALRGGHVRKASSYFGLPVLVQNGGDPLKLTTRAQVRAFNASLPCGARVKSSIAGSRYTVVTFVLTERKGSGSGCGSGTGQLAATAFAFRKRRIIEWRRVTVPPHGSFSGALST